MTTHDDRQVLVVGGGVAGLAMTATLRRGGYDPVLLTGDDRTPPSRLATLHPVGRSLFDRLAAETTRAVPATRSTETVPSELDTVGRDGTDHPVRAVTESVAARLAASVPTDAVRADGLRRLEREDDALRVRFASGVREWFDLVVVADAPVPTVDETSVGTVDLTQVEARVAADSEVRRERAARTDDGLRELLASPGGDALVRVTTGRAVDSPTARLGRALECFDGLDAREPADAVTRTVTQASSGGRWADGRVAYCGPAAFPQVPATGLGTTLALADARVLADELLAGPSSVGTAIASYGRRRRRHVRSLREAVPRGPGPGPPPQREDPLAAVMRDREAAVDGCDALAGVDRL